MARQHNDEVRAADTAPAQSQYTVLVSFTDPEDNGTVYWAGKDLYPRAGYAPGEDRIAFLQSNKTRFKRPVISGKAAK